MTDRKLWSTMPTDVARFYQNILNNVMLNAYAVRVGAFPYLLADTSDPHVARIWEEAKPLVLRMMIEKRRRGLLDDPIE